jgi:MFS family permease
VVPVTETPVATSLPRPLRPFRFRRYRVLTASLAASLTAGGLWLVALVYQVIALGGGPVQLSLVTAAAAAGLVLAVLAGGVAADRLPRRAVLVGVEAVRAGMATLAAVLALTGVVRIGHLVVLAFAVGVAEGFFYPAYSATLPALLPEDDLLAANGIEGVLRPTAQQAAGPALAGLAVSVLTPGFALAAAAAGYLLALIPLGFLGPLPRTAGATASPVEDFREGLRYLRRTGWLAATLAFAVITVLVVLGPIEVLLPFAVRDQTGAGPGGFALVLAAYGVGAALGSILIATRPLPRRYLTVMLLLWGLGSLPLVVIGVTNLVAVMVVALFVVGVTDAAAQVIWGTLLQRRVPRHLLGRVSSLDFFVSLALLPVSMALAGPVGQAIGLSLTFALAGAIPVVLAVIAIAGWSLHRDELAHPLTTP